MRRIIFTLKGEEMNRVDFGIPEPLRQLVDGAIREGWEVKTFREARTNPASGSPICREIMRLLGSTRELITYRAGWSTIVYVRWGSSQSDGIGGMCGTGFPDDMPDEALRRSFEGLLRGSINTG